MTKSTHAQSTQSESNVRITQAGLNKPAFKANVLKWIKGITIPLLLILLCEYLVRFG